MDLNKIWSDDTVRALDALGNKGVKITREVDDHVTIEYSTDEWCKLFNMGDGYQACTPEWKPFGSNKVFVRFVRVHKEEKGA